MREDTASARAGVASGEEGRSWSGLRPWGVRRGRGTGDCAAVGRRWTTASCFGGSTDHGMSEADRRWRRSAGGFVMPKGGRCNWEKSTRGGGQLVGHWAERVGGSSGLRRLPELTGDQVPRSPAQHRRWRVVLVSHGRGRSIDTRATRARSRPVRATVEEQSPSQLLPRTMSLRCRERLPRLSSRMWNPLEGYVPGRNGR